MDNNTAQRGGTPLKARAFCLASALICLVLAALSRFLDLAHASAKADIMCGAVYTETLGVLAAAAGLVMYAVAAASLIRVTSLGKKKDALLLCLLLCIIVLADRTFFVIHNVVGNVKTFEGDEFFSSVLRVLVGFVGFAAAAFTTFFALDGARSAGKSMKRLRVVGTAVFSSVLTLFCIAEQAIVTADFFRTYDDVTSMEKAQIAGDFALIIFKYGALLSGLCVLFVMLFGKTAENRAKNR